MVESRSGVRHLLGVELARRDRPPPPRGLLIAAAISALLTVISMLVVDQPLARWLGGYRPLEAWEHGLVVLEWGLLLPVFTWAFGIGLVLGMITCVAVPRWRHHAHAWAFVAATHLISRIAMVELKGATLRLRPGQWLSRGGDTFFREGSGWAFPSGHVTSFASVVIPIVVLFPRARPLLLVVAYVMAARIVANAHWLSDTLSAITLVCLVTWCCGWLTRPSRG